MKRCDFWSLSLRNIVASPLRSFLTVLGMAIGIGAILAVLTLGSAGREQVRSEMTRLGIDRVWLTAGENSRLKQGDASFLASVLQTEVTEQVYVPALLRSGGYEAQGVAVGCSKAYLQVMDTSLVKGRWLYPAEWLSGGESALVGAGLAKALRLSPGSVLSVGGTVFRCAGVIEQRNEMSQIDAAMAAFIPIAVMGDRMGLTVHELTLSVPPSVKPQALAAMAQDAMRLQKGVETQAVTMQVQIEAANSVIAIFVDVLKWVALICILVGGVGVMNILLVSVRERRREIGVMQSLGTTRRQICSLFLLEALLYALVGGIAGLMIGFWLIEAAGRSIGLRPVVQMGDCLSVLAAAVLVGLASGVWPASRASALRPVDALKED